MYEKQLQETWTLLSFEGKASFFSFLEELENSTKWFASEPTLKLFALDETSEPDVECLSEDEQWDSECTSNGIAVKFTANDGTEKVSVFNKLTAPLSTNERAGAKCQLTNVLLDKEPASYVKIINKGIATFEEPVQILVRAGRVMAIHSKKYNTISQLTIFKTSAEAMADRFKKSKMLTASYNPDVTHASYAICDGNGEFMESYAKTWKESGMPEQMLEKTYPMIDFATSDTGRYTISIRPILRIGKNTYPIGTELKMKHNGLADVAHIGMNVDKCFAEMQESITTLNELQKMKLIHPYAVFVRACRESGLYKTVKNLCCETLDNIKATYAEDDEITAFSMYREICDMQDREVFKEFAPNTILSCLEAFGRLLQLKWKEMDKSGPEDFK